MILEGTALVLSYLVGAIPSGYLVVKSIYGIDVRSHGSGNIGATNVARVTGNKALFFVIFFLDAFKAAAAVYLVQRFFDNHMLLIASAALVLFGNSFSCFLGFGGGKGISTVTGLLGVLAGPMMVPYGFITFCLMWISFIAIRRIPAGIASVYAIWAFFILYCWRTFELSSYFGLIPYHFGFMRSYDDIATAFFLFCAFLWVTIRHQQNLMAYYHRNTDKQ